MYSRRRGDHRRWDNLEDWDKWRDWLNQMCLNRDLWYRWRDSFRQTGSGEWRRKNSAEISTAIGIGYSSRAMSKRLDSKSDWHWGCSSASMSSLDCCSSMDFSLDSSKARNWKEQRETKRSMDEQESLVDHWKWPDTLAERTTEKEVYPSTSLRRQRHWLLFGIEVEMFVAMIDHWRSHWSLYLRWNDAWECGRLARCHCSLHIRCRSFESVQLETDNKSKERSRNHCEKNMRDTHLWLTVIIAGVQRWGGRGRADAIGVGIGFLFLSHVSTGRTVRGAGWRGETGGIVHRRWDNAGRGFVRKLFTIFKRPFLFEMLIIVTSMGMGHQWMIVKMRMIVNHGAGRRTGWIVRIIGELRWIDGNGHHGQRLFDEFLLLAGWPLEIMMIIRRCLLLWRCCHISEKQNASIWHRCQIILLFFLLRLSLCLSLSLSLLRARVVFLSLVRAIFSSSSSSSCFCFFTLVVGSWWNFDRWDDEGGENDVPTWIRIDRQISSISGDKCEGKGEEFK